jgi:hypothetical protein
LQNIFANHSYCHDEYGTLQAVLLGAWLPARPVFLCLPAAVQAWLQALPVFLCLHHEALWGVPCHHHEARVVTVLHDDIDGFPDPGLA